MSRGLAAAADGRCSFVPCHVRAPAGQERLADHGGLRDAGGAAGERGGVSVVAAALVAALVLLTGGCLAVVCAAEAGRRASGAADLAALAGAVELRTGGDPSAACAAAARIATANGARLQHCTTDAADVKVRCEASSRWSLPGVRRSAVRSARAGPDPAS